MKLLFFVTLVAEKIKRKQVQIYSCVCVCSSHYHRSCCISSSSYMEKIQERCLRGKCLKSTQTSSSALDEKHVATISFLSHAGLQHTPGMGRYCPLSLKCVSAGLPAKVSNLLMNKQHEHKLQPPCVRVHSLSLITVY